MKESEITALAREYAEEIYRGSAEFIDEVEQVICWLSQRFCLVEKSKVSELCRLTLEHSDSVDYGLIDGLTDAMCYMFPEQYYQVAEELSNPEIAKEVEG